MPIRSPAGPVAVHVLGRLGQRVHRPGQQHPGVPGGAGAANRPTPVPKPVIVAATATANQ